MEDDWQVVLGAAFDLVILESYAPQWNITGVLSLVWQMDCNGMVWMRCFGGSMVVLDMVDWFGHGLSGKNAPAEENCNQSRRDWAFRAR